MGNVKYIQPNHNTYFLRVESFGHTIKFRTPDNWGVHAERVVWLDGGDEYVYYKGMWYQIARTPRNTFTTVQYHGVSVSELEDIIRNAVMRRSFSASRFDYSWEEITAIRCYADANGLEYYGSYGVQSVLDMFCHEDAGSVKSIEEQADSYEDTPETMIEDASSYDDDVILFDKRQETQTLTPTNEANAREIEMMVGKAMCSYANYRGALNEHKSLVKQYGALGVEVTKAQYKSEYEATVRCIAMFVSEPVPTICQVVIDRCRSELGVN